MSAALNILANTVLGGTPPTPIPGVQITNSANQTLWLDPNLTTYTLKGAGASLVDLYTVTATNLNSQTFNSGAGAINSLMVGTLVANQIQVGNPVSNFGIGNLLLCAYDANSAANTGSWTNNPVSGRRYYAQLVNSMNYPNNNAGVSIGGNTTNIFVRFIGYIAVNTSDTYTFQITVDDGARLFVNNSKLIESWKTQGATSYTSSGVYLTVGWWVPIVAEWWQGVGGSCFQLQYKNTSNSKTFTPLTHGVNGGQIQLAYDNSECAPSQLGTTFVNGDLLVGGGLNIPTTSVPVNPSLASVTLYNDSADGLTKGLLPSGAIQNLSYGAELQVISNNTTQTGISSLYTTFINQTCNALLGGTYRIDLTYSIGTTGSSGGYPTINLFIDSVNLHANSPWINNSTICSDFIVTSLTAGTHNIVFQFKGATGITPRMDKATISIFRVG